MSGLAHDEGDVVSVLDTDGTVREGAAVPALSADKLRRMYFELRLCRRFDERMVSLQRQGRIGTYAPLAGQEAAQVGSMHALQEDDWVSYQYREHAVPAHRGLLTPYVAYWAGYEAGNAALVEGNVVPLNISIGGHVPHATGLAWAAKLRGDDCVVACHFGDGATSEGDFHEGLNFAGVFDVPAVFVCHNNGWAISHPAERQTASRSFAAKATAYGFDGVRVDGMDPLAVYQVMQDAVRKARGPGMNDDAHDGDDGRPRPTLIEAVSYRFGAHTTADDPSAYRDEGAVEAWRERDPIPRFEAFLRDRGVIDDEAVAAVEDRVEETVADAVAVLDDLEPDHDDVFADAYAELPERVRGQRAELDELVDRHGDALLRDE